MKIIFLDIDGVLNNPACYRIASGSHTPPDQACIAALNRIIKTTDAKIVVSSVWRHMGLMPCRELFFAWGIIPRTVIGVTDHTGTFPALTPRGVEIQKWLDDHEDTDYQPESFVILDDENDMEHLLPRLVLTDRSVGLTEADADRAISFLETPCTTS